MVFLRYQTFVISLFRTFRVVGEVQFERKKDKYSNSKWNLRSLFCWRSNLSNDDMIYWWQGQAENGSEK